MIRACLTCDKYALQEMDLIEQNLYAELQRAQASADANHSGESNGMLNESKSTVEAQEGAEASKSALVEKLENKKKELVCCMVNYNYCVLCLFHYLNG